MKSERLPGNRDRRSFSGSRQAIQTSMTMSCRMDREKERGGRLPIMKFGPPSESEGRSDRQTAAMPNSVPETRPDERSLRLASETARLRRSLIVTWETEISMTPITGDCESRSIHPGRRNSPRKTQPENGGLRRLRSRIGGGPREVAEPKRR